MSEQDPYAEPEYCPYCGCRTVSHTTKRAGHQAMQCLRCTECKEEYRVQKPYIKKNLVFK